MAAIENLCSRGLVLQHGNLHFDGSAKEAIQFYLNSLSTQSGTGNVVELDGVGQRRSVAGTLLKRLEFLTGDDQPLNEGLPIGAKLKIKVHFDLPKPTANFNVGLGFNNIYGQRIFTAHSVFEPARSTEEHSGAQVFSCEIPSFPLTQGEYTVKVWVDLNGSAADSIEDFYGTGKVPWNGTLVLKHHWYFEEVGGEKIPVGSDRAAFERKSVTHEL
jgi:lipopolysaccharide transport system ATP-binding protein